MFCPQVSLSENHLVSVCSEYNHVRSWRVTRFRGMISTQPGTTPKAAFKVLALEAPTAQPHNDCGEDTVTNLTLISAITYHPFLFSDKTAIERKEA